MPAYNHERFIADAITSVLDQSFGDFELVIVDDGSTDSTADIIHSFRDARLSYHYQQNQDAYNALNAAIGRSKGRYIAILNSDDFYHVERLAHLVDICENGARFVFTDVEPIDDDGHSLVDTTHPWNDWHQRNRQFYFEKNDLYRGFLRGNFMVTTSNIFMTRELGQLVGGFAPIRYLHDYDYVFRLLLAAEAQTVYLADEQLLRYRIHQGNTLSEAAIIGREQDRDVIRRYMLARLPEQLRTYVDTGASRLIELEHELIDVRRQLKPAVNRQQPAVASSFTQRALGRIKRKFVK